jgi:DNA replication protein DnaC
MLNVDDYLQIRLLHRDGVSAREIARRLGHGRDTVKKALPTMLAEYGKLSREPADADENYDQYLLRLTELEVATRSANALSARIKSAGFPALKDLETYDFSVMPSLSKQKILELARGQ